MLWISNDDLLASVLVWNDSSPADKLSKTHHAYDLIAQRSAYKYIPDGLACVNSEMQDVPRSKVRQPTGSGACSTPKDLKDMTLLLLPHIV